MDGSRGNNRLEKHKYTRICASRSTVYIHEYISKNSRSLQGNIEICWTRRETGGEASLARERSLETKQLLHSQVREQKLLLIVKRNNHM